MGAIHVASVSSSGRSYPLGDTSRSIWSYAGVHWIADANTRAPKGLCETTENRYDGLRQLASEAYHLRGVNVITDTTIQRVVIDIHPDKWTATGVELED